MPVWIPITIAAALFQCWRTAVQQKLRHLLSVNGAGFVRYLYGAPTALVLLVGALLATGLPLPAPNLLFLFHCAAGGLTQILATNLLIMAFGFRNFAVGTAYSKTETAQSAIVALIVLHEVLRPLAWMASIRHARMGSPSSWTVQAPHTPCSQPTCVPVRPA